MAGAEQLRDGSRCKRRVAREAQRNRIDRRSQFRPAEEGILRSADLLRQHDVGGLAPGEISRIDPEPTLRRRRVLEVQSQIARNHIGMAIVVEVPGGEAEPPAACRIETHGSADVTKAGPLVPEKLERHPFSGRDEIQSPVAVEINPERGSDHSSGLNELRRNLLGYIREVASITS